MKQSEYRLILMLGPVFLFFNSVLFVSVRKRTKELEDLVTNSTFQMDAIKETVENALNSHAEKLDVFLEDNEGDIDKKRPNTHKNILEKSAGINQDEPPTSGGLRFKRAEPSEVEEKDENNTDLSRETEPPKQEKQNTKPAASSKATINEEHTTEEAPLDEVPSKGEESSSTSNTPFPSDLNDAELANWRENICESEKDNICWEVHVVPPKRVTFCSAAKVASTTTKQYFHDISDGFVVIPDSAKFGVHEANWKRLGDLESSARKFVLKSTDYRHVFFWRHVVERFISGYLDKVVHDCENNETIQPHLAISHYIQYGFSCEGHKELEAFLGFMETVPKFEGHFHAQTPLCSIGKYPVTDSIKADEDLDWKLQLLSKKLGVQHPPKQERTKKHKTGAKSKMIDLLKGRPDLVTRIVNMFHEDCEKIPEACDVKDLLDAIA